MNKSEKIRKLLKKGVDRKTIEKQLKVSAQLVYAVAVSGGFIKKGKRKKAKKATFKSPRSKIIQAVTQAKQALDAIEAKRDLKDDTGKPMLDETGRMREGTRIGGLTLRKLPGDLWTWKKETESDPVNHPPHYRAGGIETIDFIEAKDLNYRLGNVVKYVSRAGRKLDSNPVEDLEKAAWYLNREIEARRNA